MKIDYGRFIKFYLVCYLLTWSGCAHAKYPAVLRTNGDVEMASGSWYAISIGELPLNLYSKLGKFRDVEHVFFKDNASDAKLIALSAIELPKLRSIVLGDSSEVSDVGFLALANFTALESLQIMGASVTDNIAKEISRFPKLIGLNVVNCNRLSFDGLHQLFAAKSWSLGIVFSANNLTVDEIKKLVMLLPRGAHCGIVGHVDEASKTLLHKVASEQKIFINIKEKYLSDPADPYGQTEKRFKS